MPFMVTTPIESFWDRSKPILFAGEWCKLFARKAQWTTLDHSDVPHLWDDPQKKVDAIEYSEQVRQTALAGLTDFLNRHHGLNETTRFYHIVLGNWLDHYVQVMYDRFLTLEKAFELHADLETWVLDPKQHYIPTDTMDWVSLISLGDRYNLQVFSRMLHGMGYAFPTRELEDPLPQKARFSTPNWRPGERVAYGVTQWLSKLFRRRRITVVNPYFKYGVWRRMVQLMLMSRLQITFNTFLYPVSVELPIDRALRAQSLDLGRSRFEKALGKIIIGDMPALFLEGFASFREQVLALRFPKSDAYFTANAMHFNPVFKLFAAMQQGRSKFLLMQHGSGEGFDYHNQIEFYERSVADRFYTYGWRDGDHTEPLSFAHPGEHRPGGPDGLMIFTISEYFRYVYRLHFHPTAGEYLTLCMQEIDDFMAQFKQDRTLMVRCWQPVDMKWDTVGRLRETHGDGFQVDDQSKNLIERLSNCRIHVSHHIGTAFIEALAMNVPTVAFINPRIYHFREPAIPIMQALAACGLLHYSVVGAIAHLKAVHQDPQVWWSGEDVQAARRQFLHHYGRTSKNWLKEWQLAFQRAIDEPS
ncbi:MAG: hypothetical protein HQL53_10060 [Magnetococcales bacterium]|nr:hypothetical protein [Magnetococcales bacterium]